MMNREALLTSSAVADLSWKLQSVLGPNLIGTFSLKCTVRPPSNNVAAWAKKGDILKAFVYNCQHTLIGSKVLYVFLHT